MAPYAVAHMKLGLQLKESGYDFAADERLRVYLTNTLEEAHVMTGLPLFTQWLAEEAAAAGIVKKNVPIMVVLGKPGMIVSDNGTEFTSNAMLAWAEEQHYLALHRTGQTHAERFLREFQRSDAR
jgi:hypothetical protein